MFVEYPNQVEYQCHEGYSLDGKWGNVSDVNNTNMFFLSACTLDGFFSQSWRIPVFPCHVVWHPSWDWQRACHRCLSCLVLRRSSDLTSWSWHACQTKSLKSGEALSLRVWSSCALRLRSRAHRRRQCGEHCEFHSHVQWQRDVHTRAAGLMSASGVFSVASGCRIRFSLSNLCGDRSVRVRQRITGVHLQAWIFDTG